METGSAENFERMGTLGIEEEFFVVDESGRPVSGTDELVYANDPPGVLADRLDHELFKCVIETQTPIIGSLPEAGDALREVRDTLVSYAAAHGYRIAAAGLHPAAKWRELDHAEKPRYRSQLDRIQYPQHRNTTAGLHVHVGVDDADKAVWVANEIRWFLPIMLALSANSPYWNGFDTGLASARAKVFEGLPNTGMPTSFESFEEFATFERLLVERGSINDRGELWYDVRPHSEHGTVEVRTPDGQADPEYVLAFVEYVHALVTDLAERYEDRADPWAAYRSSGHGPRDGEAGYDHRRELLDENKWRAMRYGHAASFIDRDHSGVISLSEVVDRECDRLDVSGIGRLYDAESGASRQRRIRRESGPEALYESLVL
ncbi:glutamate--cysteine ligase [Halalkalicoccus jeotgali]|uniref:Glutamate--cysteine ligase n=1 Tax=Halalkalicoccus jeotgali (strain DSM 18796 / CECT 7217 / JCM 14584 / KCTC 4019 / B3) TaxID=795797 RepID=D8J2I8_HALJB|nr:glutamate--cysteine ligase [Halalkalicoccus jeotgali]ADJ14945.1 carboxylate-amine ligase [Halalkalicoccus jeotgali B3]ELY35039.1 carboxylate-amine ligase [Halalkalicoccus jeotgali B3]